MAFEYQTKSHQFISHANYDQYSPQSHLFRSSLNYGPFNDWTGLDHSNTRLIGSSDSHYIYNKTGLQPVSRPLEQIFGFFS